MAVILIWKKHQITWRCEKSQTPCDFFQKTKAEQLDELLYSQNASLSPNQIKLYESLLIDIGAESRDFSYYAEELCKSYDKADKENDQNQLQSFGLKA